MRHSWWLAFAMLMLVGCSSPSEQAGRALRQAQGWAATAEAVTSSRQRPALPAQFVARTLNAGAAAVEQHARDIDNIDTLSAAERRSCGDALGKLAAALRASASSAQAGRVGAEDHAALLDAYAGVMARARTYPR